VVRVDTTMTTLYRGGTSSTSPELNTDFKIIQNQSGNVVAVPPDVHGGHGGGGVHHAVVRSVCYSYTYSYDLLSYCVTCVKQLQLQCLRRKFIALTA
jgi:hypothetical protein